MAENKNSPKKKEFSPRVMKIIITAAGWLLILAAAALDTSIAVPVYKIYSDKVTKPVRIVLLTDFHSSSYGKEQQVLIDAVNAQKPDVILLAGDIFEDVRPHKHSIELLERLGKSYPCFYVTGNHEVWSGEVNEIKETVRSLGVTVLAGDGETRDFAGQSIRICGVDDPAGGKQFADCARMAGDDTFTVLMSHRPDLVKLYSGNGFDLVVCGHAHGGQVRIPGLLNGLYAPNQGLFPKYAGGRYLLDDGSTEMVVSRGLCKNVLPRVFNRPEVVVIDIEPRQTGGN